MTSLRGRLLPLAAIAVFLLAGCSSEQPAQRSPSSKGDDPPASQPPTLATGSEALPAGTYALDLDARAGSGDELFPTITIDVPDGWKNHDGWAINTGADEHAMGMSFWDVDEVFAHPCQWQGRMIQPGPTVAGLADVLAKRPLRDATAPESITVDGFQGVELEWSVPTDFDLSTCDEDVVVGDHPFKSWTAAAGTWAGERYHQGPGQVDRLWILDIDGERLVVDAWHMPATDARDHKELFEIMGSIRFDV